MLAAQRCLPAVLSSLLAMLLAANTCPAQQPARGVQSFVRPAAAMMADDGELPLVPLPTETIPPEPMLPPVPANPPPRNGLALDEVEAMAIAANPSLQRASALVGAARGNWVQVGLLPNPTVGYQGQQIGSGGLAEQHGVMFNQDIVLGGKLGLNQAVAEREIEIARQIWETQRLRVVTDVRIAFYQALAAQRQIDLTHELLRVSQQGVETVDSLLKAMEVSRADLLQAELEVENAQILAQTARHRHDSAWRALAAVSGNADLPVQALAGDLFAAPQEFAYEATLSQLRATSPEVAAAAVEIDRAQAALERARVEPIPNVSFQGLINWQDNGIGGGADGGVALTVPWPLFNRNQGNILKAQHEVAAAQQALSQVELDLAQRFAVVYERYANARYQVERYRTKVIPAAAESLSLTRKTYLAGETGFISLLTAQRTYAQIQLNYLEAQQALRIAESEIAGQLLRDSLTRR